MPPDETPPEPADMPRFLPPDSSGIGWPYAPTHPDLRPPPPPRAEPAPPPPEPASASAWQGWVVAVVVATTVLPTLFFLYVGFRPQGHATESATGALLWLTGIELIVGAAAAALAWWLARRPASEARSLGLSLLLTLAGLWGLVTGFLGGISITMTRNPNLDDA